MNQLALRLLRPIANGSLAVPTSVFLESLRDLRLPRPLAIAFGLGAAAWMLECAAFFVVLWGLHFTPSLALAGQASFIYPVSNLAGSLSLVPGGLGVAEGSAAGLTSTFVAGATASTALAAGLLIRLAILGFGVVTGLPGLFYVMSRIGRTQTRREVVEAQAA